MVSSAVPPLFVRGTPLVLLKPVAVFTCTLARGPSFPAAAGGAPAATQGCTNANTHAPGGDTQVAKYNGTSTSSGRPDLTPWHQL